MNSQNFLGRLVDVRWYGNSGGNRPDNGNSSQDGGLGGVDDRPDDGVLAGRGGHETGEEQDLHAGLTDWRTTNGLLARHARRFIVFFKLIG